MRLSAIGHLATSRRSREARGVIIEELQRAGVAACANISPVTATTTNDSQVEIPMVGTTQIVTRHRVRAIYGGDEARAGLMTAHVLVVAIETSGPQRYRLQSFRGSCAKSSALAASLSPTTSR